MSRSGRQAAERCRDRTRQGVCWKGLASTRRHVHESPEGGLEEDVKATLSNISADRIDLIATARLAIETDGAGFYDVTREVRRFVHEAGAKNGAVLLYMRHTSASLVIQENADPD